MLEYKYKIYKLITQPEDGPQVGPKHVVVFIYVLIRKYSCVLTVCIIHNILLLLNQQNGDDAPQNNTVLFKKIY